TCAHIDELADAIAKDAGQVDLRVVPEADEQVSALVEKVRAENQAEASQEHDGKLAEALSELRLVKDDWEVGQMREAVAATISGFADIVRALPRATTHPRGERVVEGAFAAVAREEGNGLGYDTIAASGNNATTLHWIRNTGEVREGDLILVDAGVEIDSLYTADITRTPPVDGTFTDVQRKIYQAVLDAAVAREEGNGLGYDTIAASGNNATTLHWIRNTGEVREGDLILVDAGVEIDSLYTADITRTPPVDGTFTDVQRKIYQAVLDAAD